MTVSYMAYSSPLGTIRVVSNKTGVTRIEIFEEDWEKVLAADPTLKEEPSAIGSEAIQQLEEYFNGNRKEFHLPLAIEGTEFRKQVWSALQLIPYGESRSYREVAEMIDNPKAVRAVGQANKANRWPIVIPCHRVIGKSGNLVGYAGDRTPFQQVLLEMEGYLPRAKGN